MLVIAKFLQLWFVGEVNRDVQKCEQQVSNGTDSLTLFLVSHFLNICRRCGLVVECADGVYDCVSDAADCCAQTYSICNLDLRMRIRNLPQKRLAKICHLNLETTGYSDPWSKATSILDVGKGHPAG